MLTSCSARVWQSLPSVPGLSSKRMVNSLMMGMLETSFWYASVMGWKVLRGVKMQGSYAVVDLTARVGRRRMDAQSEESIRPLPHLRNVSTRLPHVLSGHSNTQE